MSDWTMGLLSGFGGLVAGFIATWIASQVKIDENLLAKRADIYSELWKMTGILPRYPKDEALTYEQLQERSRELREWYFEKSGGIYLSRRSQKLYLAFQQSIHNLLDNQTTDLKSRVSPTDYEGAMVAGSTLRTSMTADLHTRRRWSLI